MPDISEAHPRIYRPGVFLRIGMPLLVVGIGLVAAFAGASRAGGLATAIVFLLISLAVAGGIAAWCGRQVLRLYPDRLEASRLTSDLVIRRGELWGYRKAARNGASQLTLFRSSTDPDPIKLTLYGADPELDHWLSPLVDRDSLDRQAAEAESLHDDRFGATESERRRSLGAWSWIGGPMSLAGFGLAAWCLIFPIPVPIAVVVAGLAPLVAIILIPLSGNRVALFVRPGSLQTSSLALAVTPAFAVALRAFLDIQLYQPLAIAPWVLGFTVLIAIVCFGLDASVRQQRGLAALAVLALAWGYGLAMQLNVLVGWTQVTVYAAQVAEKHSTHGRHASYHLTLADSTDPAVGDDQTVGFDVYDRVKEGDKVCIFSRPGYLGAAWYEINTCDVQNALYYPMPK